MAMDIHGWETTVAALATCLATVVACSGVSDYPAASGGTPTHGNGGHTAAGGTNSGGAISGGASAAAQGGNISSASGGSVAAHGGTGSGGQPSGSGGMSTQGGNQASGGSLSLGGTGQGGASTGGTAGGKVGNAGQNSGGAGGSSGASTGFSQVQSILEAKCSQCHTLGGNHPDLSTTGDELYTTLSTYRVRDCGNNPLVIPGNSATSALIMVTTAGKCANRLVMPSGCSGDSCVLMQERQTISNWITQGAKR
ncbi:MAG: hypothetical protein ACOY0T_05415 [Myxococcota bacterium]